MNLQIKSLSGELTEEEKRLLRKKLLRLEEYIPNSSVLTVGLKQHITKKSNQAYEIIIHLIIPSVKRSVYVKVFKNSFTEAVDVAKDKVEDIVIKRKNKKLSLRFKVPKFSLGFLRKKNEESA
ncbi:MAG: hypothetical protein OEV37_02335 [Candidatus Berkelbacteria bacterium]|nr:hypothetical protein [Candidatus Berkelbacteria bacterium]